MLGLLVPLCFAHPVPKDSHDRVVIVQLTAEAVVVDYRLEVDETTAAQDLPRSEIAGITLRRELHDAFCRHYAETIADNLAATLDSAPLTFRCLQRGQQMLDSFRCDFRFEARWPKRADKGPRHLFTLNESNFERDETGQIRLALAGLPSVTLEETVVPAQALQELPAARWRPGDAERRRQVSATFQILPQDPKAVVKLSLPPDDPPPRQGPLPGRPAAAEVKPGAGAETAASKPGPGETDAHHSDLLDLLFDTRTGLSLLLLLAAGFGAAHALTPGHGKTLVAAYLVAERGTVGHAFLLGLVTTLAHTGAVLLVAVLLLFFPQAVPAVMGLLGLVGGLLVAGLGLWLLLRRLAGQADHVHLGSGHHHHGHGHDHAELEIAVRPGWWGMIVLGLSGGMVPCTDAILLLIYAIANGRFWMALPLLLAFSAGLAAVLIAIGIGVVYVGRFADGRWGESNRWQTVARMLPIISAALITVLGLWLCFGSVREH